MHNAILHMTHVLMKWVALTFSFATTSAVWMTVYA